MKYKATITFVVDDDVKPSDVEAMLEDDLTSGEFFVKNEEPGDHVKDICVQECEKMFEKLFCPICGKDEGEVTADVLERPGYVHCHCRHCDETWEMFDPVVKDKIIDSTAKKLAKEELDAGHRKHRGKVNDK